MSTVVNPSPLTGWDCDGARGFEDWRGNDHDCPECGGSGKRGPQ